MAFKNLPEYLKGESPVFEGRKFDLYLKEFSAPDGKIHKLDAIVHPGAVVIIPFLSQDKIVLIRNYRRILEKMLWELPAGTLEAAEPPLETAKRELIEETGYAAESIKPVTSFYTSPGISNELMHVFIAETLISVGQKLEPIEEIEVNVVTLDAALKMIKNQEIRDGKTIAALLYYSTFFDGSRLSFID